MKSTIIFILLFASTVFAQTPTTDSRRVIEVTGSAEMMITPNEFTFKITLVERVDGKKKITIEDQEAALRRELTALGIDVQKDLTVYDISSVYVRQRRLKDTLGSKDYRLKITDINKLGPLQDLADRINVARLDLIESTHGDLPKFRRETKMEAIKAAKMKAEYLLGAIGERVGKPVFVREVEESQELSNFRTGSLNSNSSMGFSTNGRRETDEESAGLSITKFKIRFEIFARFEIE